MFYNEFVGQSYEINIFFQTGFSVHVVMFFKNRSQLLVLR